MAPLPETAATRVDERVDASSTSAASAHSCSASLDLGSGAIDLHYTHKHTVDF